MRQAITSPRAPGAVGPYSAALRAGPLLFISGQLPMDAATGVLLAGTIADQTRTVLGHIGALLASAGLGYPDVVRTTVFLADLGDFGAMNEVYETFFAPPYPARSTIQAARLPRDARIEIDAIAMYANGRAQD